MTENKNTLSYKIVSVAIIMWSQDTDCLPTCCSEGWNHRQAGEQEKLVQGHENIFYGD